MTSTTPAPQSPPAVAMWDPTAAPYTTRDCREGRHERCQGGLVYYPDGTRGAPVDVPCACQHHEH